MSKHVVIKVSSSVSRLQSIVKKMGGKFHGNYTPNLKVEYMKSKLFSMGQQKRQKEEKEALLLFLSLRPIRYCWRTSSRRRTYAFYPAEFKGLSRLRVSRVDLGNFTLSPSRNRI